jgi:hypothetical protein
MAGRLDPRTGRPTQAVALQGLLACVAILVGSSRVDVLLTGMAFADALFQAAVAVVLLRVRKTPAAGVLRAPAPAAWIFLVLELGLAIGCLLRRPLESAYGAAVLVAGTGVYWLWRRAR